MAPKRSKTEVDADTVYRSGAPLRQKKFPDRRSVRRSLPTARTPRLRQQSTLTQRWSLDGANSDPTDVVDDIEDEDDAEFDVQKPKRKKRKTGSGGERRSVGKSQNTMTQMGYVTSFDSDDVIDGAEKDDGTSVYDMLRPENAQDDIIRETQSAMSAQDIQNAAVESMRSSPIARLPDRPSPEIAMSNPQPITPRKKFPSTIPSSNTPMSALQFSTQPSQSQRSPSKSPLKDRSVNVPDSPFRRTFSPIRETPVKVEQPFSPWAVRRTPLFRVPDKPVRAPPSLQHRTTIPDSDDLPVRDTQLQISPRAAKPTRTLKRIPSTVQDSQLGISGQEITSLSETQHVQLGQDMTQEEYQATLPYDYTQYDAVASALERDAARCDQTQRLHRMRRTMQPDVVLATQNHATHQVRFNSIDELGKANDITDTGGQVSHDTMVDKEHLEQCSSIKSESLPGSPAKPERSRHRPRFLNMDVVDLTADSFEALNPTTSGSPSPKHNSGGRMPVLDIVTVPSSPPLLPNEETEYVDAVEYLPLNDTRPTTIKEHSAVSSKTRTSSVSLPHPDDLVDANFELPLSQVSTVGHRTQLSRTQNARTQRTQIKHDPEAPYFSTPRSNRFGAQDFDLDEDEEVDIDVPILSTQHLHTSNIEHIDLSDDLAANEDAEFIDIDDETIVPISSPYPIAPGHAREEYQGVDDGGGELSSSLPAQIPAPPPVSSDRVAEVDGRTNSPTTSIMRAVPAAIGGVNIEPGIWNETTRLPRPPWEIAGMKPRVQRPVLAGRKGRDHSISIPDSDSEGDVYETDDFDNPGQDRKLGDDIGFVGQRQSSREQVESQPAHDEGVLGRDHGVLELEQHEERGHSYSYDHALSHPYHQDHNHQPNPYHSHPQEEGQEQQQTMQHDQDQDSWEFRPAREIVPDTQFSFPFPPLLPPPPSSSVLSSQGR